MLKNLNKREKRIAYATLSIISIALIYAFMIEPLSGRWAYLSDEIDSKLNVLKKDSKLLSAHKNLKADYLELSKYVKSIKDEETDTAAILSYIETVSRNDSCLIVNIKPMGVRNMGSYKEILIDITAEASMQQFSKFLYDIENPRNMMLRVRRFSINSKTGQAGILKGTFLVSKILMN